ncbi:type 2 lanthipeptide synthetase LanM family protein [Sorangium sp. So ce1182]|uniref:type 2 lanthipeptide synthetase LanM family protein n=1 Tax=Sorangium sp. So ce1182 TaxID=3133334 RepID=UPI003F5E1A26
MTADIEARARRIAAQASTLWERLGGPYAPEGGAECAALAAARLGRWREKAAAGDAALFGRRLSWLGLTPETATAYLGEVRLEGPPPPWTATFLRAMEAARLDGGGGARGSDRPFSGALRPFVEAGSVMIPGRCRALFTAGALDDLVDDLLRELSYIASPTLYLAFVRFRAARGGAAGAPPGRALYDAFTAEQLAGGLWGLFSEYPVLARLMSSIVDAWARNVAELAAALEDDLPEIQRVFGDGSAAGRVAAVWPSLSDRRRGGRAVARLEFEGGLRLYYKPRGLGVERAWYALLRYLNERGGDFRILRTLEREGRGWAEPADHAPCHDAEEARRFYVRAGMLLGVLHVLGATDCFHENIVACGGHPALIDAETLMQPVLARRVGVAPADEIADGTLSSSVLRVGLLPSWEVDGDGRCVDISGLGAAPGQVTSYLKRRWRDVNTDAMLLEHVPITVETRAHLPELDGTPLRASDHAEQLAEGFRAMYLLLAGRREELAAPGGPLDDLAGQEIRVLFRATRVYGLLSKRLCSPRHMRSGVERSIETDVIGRFYLDPREDPGAALLLAAEIDAMERLDIPSFAARADGRAVALPTGEVIERALEEPAVDRARRRLSSLDEADLELQTGLLRASLRLPAAPAGRRAAAAMGREDAAEDEPLSRDELAAEAASIAAAIEEHGIFAGDAGATWLAPQRSPQAGRYQLRPLRMDLYGGLAGIALFFSALEHTSGRGRRVALAALAPLRRFVAMADAREQARRGYTLGAATGAGSFVYALCRCASLLGEPALHEEAAGAAELITPAWIEGDEALDVLSGAAGAVLGLLALHGATRDSGALDKAVLAGERLLRRRARTAPGAAAWQAARGRALAGLAHGAAGIALALLRLHGATGDVRFRRAAEEAVNFEGALFDPARGNWPDLRVAREGGAAFMNAWCHGAAGIGLARTSGLPHLDSPGIRRDIDAAVTAVARHGAGDKDGVCCGELGRAELLLAAARATARADLEELALRRASAVVRRARAAGYRCSGCEGRGLFDPSFFQGLSGIGYQLLRLAYPSRLPSVLSLE